MNTLLDQIESTLTFVEDIFVDWFLSLTCM